MEDVCRQALVSGEEIAEQQQVIRDKEAQLYGHLAPQQVPIVPKSRAQTKARTVPVDDGMRGNGNQDWSSVGHVKQHGFND